VDGTGVHVMSATAPADNYPTTRPANHLHIRISGNAFNNNGPAPANRTIVATDAGKPVDNPLARLSPEGVALLKTRNVDIQPMQKMKAVLITTKYLGAARRDIVNKDPNLILVFGKGFNTHGTVTSVGPIVATDDAMFMNAVTGDSLVWFADESFPRGDTTGSPIICGPKAHINQAKWKSDEVWIGTYGWGK
jgi:hypothetical protein